MKNIIKLFLALILILMTYTKSYALNFEEAFSQTNKTPMVVLIYAQWADNYQYSLEQFRLTQNDFKTSYNFVELDIATNDAKAFNDKFHIYPKLPYALMFKENGKISRYIPGNCVNEKSCLSTKLTSFIY